jgi:hypothetical protein
MLTLNRVVVDAFDLFASFILPNKYLLKPFRDVSLFRGKINTALNH